MRNRFRSWLRVWAWWILGTVKPTHDEIDGALLKAFAQSGLSVDKYSPDYDLLHSGKLHEVIVHASAN